MFQVDLVCLSLVQLLVKRFFCKWDRSRDFLTKADNVSFDIESSDDKDSFIVVVVDSLAVCDRVFRVVLGICCFYEYLPNYRQWRLFCGNLISRLIIYMAKIEYATERGQFTYIYLKNSIIIYASGDQTANCHHLGVIGITLCWILYLDFPLYTAISKGGWYKQDVKEWLKSL